MQLKNSYLYKLSINIDLINLDNLFKNLLYDSNIPYLLIS